MISGSQKHPLFDLAAIRQQVGAKVFDRGEAYFHDDTVALSGIANGKINARVAGTEIYRVALDLGEKRPTRRLAGDCSCPARIDFGLCKHMVATAFAANAAEEADAWPKAEEQPSTTLEAWLAMLTKERLVALVLELAEIDGEIERRLLLKAAVSPIAGSLAPAAAAISRALRQAGAIPGGYIDYRAMSGWADGLLDVLDAIEAIIAPDCSTHVRPLLETVLDRAENAQQNGDDSDGSLGPVFERIDGLLLKMRLADPPEPMVLARDLFGELMDSDAYRHVPMEAYWPLLGDKGRDELERLARELWPSVQPKRRSGGYVQDYVPLRHELFQLLDRISERKRDLAARIALRREDARSAYDIVRLAEFLIEEGRAEEALAAAEAGHFEFADRPDDRLTGLLADFYRKHGAAAKAEELLWSRFAARPDMRGFEMLVGSPGKAKVALEEKAIEHVQELHARMGEGGKPQAGAVPFAAVSLLLEVFTKTRRYAEAWTLADAERLPPTRLRSLAEASVGGHADKALPVLRALAESALREGVGGRYGEPLRLIDLIMTHARGDARAESSQWLEALRRDHARKRNFLAGLSTRQA